MIKFQSNKLWKKKNVSFPSFCCYQTVKCKNDRFDLAEDKTGDGLDRNLSITQMKQSKPKQQRFKESVCINMRSFVVIIVRANMIMDRAAIIISLHDKCRLYDSPRYIFSTKCFGID